MRPFFTIPCDQGMSGVTGRGSSCGLSLERLRSLVSYDPATGFFHWAKSHGAHKKGARCGSIYTHHTGALKYEAIRIDGRRYRAHRLAFFYMTGEWPDELIDHKDGNGLNNAWENLRAATFSQNNANARLSKNSTTGRKGVTYDAKYGVYRAFIGVDRKRHYLGSFPSAEMAHAAYVEAARLHFASFARAE